MLNIGTTAGGDPLALSDVERSTHVHIVGATDSGKSKLLEHMIRQDIARGRGLCLIDPHGFLSDAIERWCAARGVARLRRIHLVKPGDPRWTAGFNPLRLDRGESPGVRVDYMVAACAQVWGGEDLNQTPRLKKMLHAVFYALAVNGLTLPDALLFLRSDDPGSLRRRLTSGLSDPAIEFVWGELNRLPRREFAEYTESTISRLTPLLDSEAVRLMLGQQANALDFRQIVDDGDIVLVNLGARAAFSRENARIVGALLINDLFLTALARDERTARRKPFSLYVDEAHQYLSGDIEHILDETRKFGLHAVLAHQRLQQLLDRGPNVYSAVMGSARTKIVFGGLQDDDAAVMAREILRESIDVDRPKHVLDKPIVVDEVPYWFEARSWTTNESSGRTITESSGWVESSGTSAGESQNYRLQNGLNQAGPTFFGLTARGLPSAISITGGTTTSSSTSAGTSESTSYAASRSESRTRTEGRVAIREWLPTATYSIDEQFHMGQAMLRGLPKQHAVIKRIGKKAESVRIADVSPPLTGSALMSRFREAVCVASPYLTLIRVPTADVSHPAERQPDLSRAAEEVIDVEFWTE